MLPTTNLQERDDWRTIWMMLVGSWYLLGKAEPFLQRSKISYRRAQTFASGILSNAVGPEDSWTALVRHPWPAGFWPFRACRDWLCTTPSVREMGRPRWIETMNADVGASYHRQALTQAAVWFWVSVAAAAAGFLWILYTGLATDLSSGAYIARLSPSVISEAVAFLFFRQASAARERATELFDRHRRDRQVEGSSALVASIQDVTLRSAVQAQLALQMSGLKPKPIDLSTFVAPQTVANPEGRSVPGLEAAADD
jgi:Cyanobacterial TRADD-N associated 2-Transmembrane domain